MNRMRRSASRPMTGITPPHGPHPTTFGPLAALDRRPVAALTAVVTVLVLVGVWVLALPDKPELVWILSILGVVTGYLAHRRRSHRPWLQIGLSSVLPGLFATFCVAVSGDPYAVIASAGLIPASILGHLLARLVERLFGPRRKVLRAAWSGVSMVGSRNQPDALMFDVRPLAASVDKQTAREFRPHVRNSTLAVRSTVLKWLFIIAAPIIVLVLITGFIDVATTSGEDVASQLVGFSAFVLLMILGYTVIGWFGFRGSRHATTLADHVRLAWFAQLNGFDYTAGPIGDRYGRELSRMMRVPEGRRWVMANAVRAAPIPEESSAAGTFFSGFCEFQVRVPLPNLLLVSRRPKLPSFSSHAAPRSSQRLSLEGDFNRHFDLFCPRGYERDALYILTPDVMARLIDGVRDFDVEFIDDRLVLRTPGDMVTLDPGQWQRIAVAVNALNDRVQQWARWRDDRHESRIESSSTRLLTEKPTGAALAGRRLRTGLSVGGLLLFAFGAVYVGLVLISNSL